MKQKLAELKRKKKINSYFYILLSIMNTKQKISKGIEDLTNTIIQLDLTDIYTENK